MYTGAAPQAPAGADELRARRAASPPLAARAILAYFPPFLPPSFFSSPPFLSPPFLSSLFCLGGIVCVRGAQWLFVGSPSLLKASFLRLVLARPSSGTFCARSSQTRANLARPGGA